MGLFMELNPVKINLGNSSLAAATSSFIEVK